MYVLYVLAVMAYDTETYTIPMKFSKDNAWNA